MAGFTGGCLCGAVRYTSDVDPAMMGHCHCEDCRRSSGTGHSSHLAVPAEALKLTGALSAYDRPADSGNMVTRFFCPTCGAPVMSRNAARPGLAFMRASTLDDLGVFKPQVVVFTSRAAPWDGIVGLPSFERMPPQMPG